jgi:hypothetical protein
VHLVHSLDRNGCQKKLVIDFLFRRKHKVVLHASPPLFMTSRYHAEHWLHARSIRDMGGDEEFHEPATNMGFHKANGEVYVRRRSGFPSSEAFKENANFIGRTRWSRCSVAPKWFAMASRWRSLDQLKPRVAQAP